MNSFAYNLGVNWFMQNVMLVLQDGLGTRGWRVMYSLVPSPLSYSSKDWSRLGTWTLGKRS